MPFTHAVPKLQNYWSSEAPNDVVYVIKLDASFQALGWKFQTQYWSSFFAVFLKWASSRVGLMCNLSSPAVSLETAIGFVLSPIREKLCLYLRASFCGPVWTGLFQLNWTKYNNGCFWWIYNDEIGLIKLNDNSIYYVIQSNIFQTDPPNEAPHFEKKQREKMWL